MRVNLSQIHPLKRVILIGLWFMLGLFLAVALVAQFVQANAVVYSPIGMFRVSADNRDVTLLRCEFFSGSTRVSFEPGVYQVSVLELWSATFDNHQYLQPDSSTQVSLPGLIIHQASGHSYLFDSQSVKIHHLWLIGITAALYVVTRARIRRSVIRQAVTKRQPLLPCE